MDELHSKGWIIMN